MDIKPQIDAQMQENNRLKTYRNEKKHVVQVLKAKETLNL